MPRDHLDAPPSRASAQTCHHLPRPVGEPGDGGGHRSYCSQATCGRGRQVPPCCRQQLARPVSEGKTWECCHPGCLSFRGRGQVSPRSENEVNVAGSLPARWVQALQMRRGARPQREWVGRPGRGSHGTVRSQQRRPLCTKPSAVARGTQVPAAGESCLNGGASGEGGDLAGTPASVSVPDMTWGDCTASGGHAPVSTK